MMTMISKTMMTSFFVLMLALGLVSCTPDPRKTAEANAINAEAEQRAADEKQARAQAAEEHDIKMQNARAAQVAWQTFANDVIVFSSYFVRFTLMLWLLSAGVGGVFVVKASVLAYAKYANRRAEVMAEIIKLDKGTHTFPVMLVDTGKNVKALMNPNDNSVTLFDVNNPADRAKVMAMANVLHADTLAGHARLSHKPGEVAGIEARQIIESE
jgi:hypothetical protein